MRAAQCALTHIRGICRKFCPADARAYKVGKRVMRILFVVDNYMGGAGNIIQLLATEYAKTDEVTVLLTHKTIEKRYGCPGVKFIELDSEEKPTGIRALTYQIGWVRRQVKHVAPDVIISFLTSNSIITCLGQMFSRIPIIACERNDPAIINRRFPWNILTRIAYRRADLLTVQFDGFVDFDGGRYVDKCRVTPNYVATPDRFKDHTSVSEVTRFISCGRLAPAKRFSMLLEMFAEIHRREPKTELRIYGHGSQREMLEEKISELGLEGAAILAGYTSDTYGVLCDSDVYLMTSKHEGFPNALSEALAVGLSSVSFGCHKGIDELLDNGRRGVSVAQNDREAFVDAALELCRDREKRLAYSAAAKEVSDVYSMKNVKAIWDECIKEACEKRSNVK